MTGITGLLKIELPSGDVLLSDGGVTIYNGDAYTPEDPYLGSLSSIESVVEGTGQQMPVLDVSFSPPGNVAINTLSAGAIQQSRVRLYVAEYDTDTGLVVGTPELRFIGFVDQPQVNIAYRQISVTISAVPDLEALFMKDRGNGLSSAFHKSLYPGETGHDNATGLKIPVAWGTEAPRAAYSGGSSWGGVHGWSLARNVSYQ
ncbi:hypothetical protein AB1K62_14325 [Parasphingorhabdus sp. JC815]|uniref:hypothetical protein n=1 Tax=Parasphingorhabdus sp. JC815 TaxID=3232140 RepID=UPI00345AB4A4